MKKSFCTIALIGLFPLLILISCRGKENRTKENPVARVHARYLYPSELKGIFSNRYDWNDSVQTARNYIDKWIKKELLVEKAKLNLTEEELNEIDSQVEETRASLIIYKYEQQLQKQKVDTNITEEEIQSYYDANSSNFIVDKNIVKAIFIKIPRGAPNIDRVRSWYRSSNDQDMNDLESYCYQYATKYDLFNESWTDFGNIKIQLPSEIINDQQFLKYNPWFEMQDSSSYYFVRIREYQLAGNVSPAPYVHDKIKSIILNKRKIEFIKQLENNIYTDGLKSNEFEIYEK
jgi:hypothetical protein